MTDQFSHFHKDHCNRAFISLLPHPLLQLQEYFVRPSWMIFYVQIQLYEELRRKPKIVFSFIFRAETCYIYARSGLTRPEVGYIIYEPAWLQSSFLCICTHCVVSDLFRYKDLCVKHFFISRSMFTSGWHWCNELVHEYYCEFEFLFSHCESLFAAEQECPSSSSYNVCWKMLTGENNEQIPRVCDVGGIHMNLTGKD